MLATGLSFDWLDGQSSWGDVASQSDYFGPLLSGLNSHSKLKLANSCWQTQVGVCERHKNSWQTRWQTVGDK